MKRSLAFVLAIATATARTPFGDVSGYNMVTFDGFSCAGNDVQGRLAVGGNAAFNNGFLVGCEANIDTNPTLTDQCPSFGSWKCSDLNAAEGTPNYYGLVVAGELSFPQGSVSGGLAFGSVHGSVNPTRLADCTTSNAQPINFANTKSYLTALASRLSSRTATGTATNTYGTLTLTGTGTTGIETFFVSGATLNTVNTLATFQNVDPAATIVINVDGTSITMNGGTSAFKSNSNRIVWNFYEATSISLNGYAFMGSLLAPTANIVGSNGVFWGQVFINSFVTNSADFWNPGSCAQVNYIPFERDLPGPPAGTCGDSVVDDSEDCDSGVANGQVGSCCSSTCTYVASNVVCRAAAGECDNVEMCTGSSAVCPADTFKPEATPCSQPFGICNLELQYHCPGNAATCMEVAPNALFEWDAYTLISFNSYTANGGDIEGAMAVRNRANLASYDVGLKLGQSDAYTLFSLLVARNATWVSGEVHPDAGSPWTDRNGNTFPQGYIGVGGIFEAPAYLQASVLQNAYITGAQFDEAQQYYQKIQNLLAGLPTNAEAKVIYGNGLQVTCDASATGLVHFTVSGDILSKTQWYITVGCQFDAGYIIDVTGSGNVVIQGGAFSGIVEKVVYNVLGSGRTITGATGVSGNILAPGNSYTQNAGVTYGRVIVADVPEARQNNKPNCTDFKSVTISNIVLERVEIGDKWIYVVDASNYNVGDKLCFNGECSPIVLALELPDRFKIQVANSFSSPIPAAALMTTTVDANAARNDPIPITQQNGESSSASALIVGVASVALAMAL